MQSATGIVLHGFGAHSLHVSHYPSKPSCHLTPLPVISPQPSVPLIIHLFFSIFDCQSLHLSFQFIFFLSSPALCKCNRGIHVQLKVLSHTVNTQVWINIWGLQTQMIGEEQSSRVFLCIFQNCTWSKLKNSILMCWFVVILFYNLASLTLITVFFMLSTINNIRQGGSYSDIFLFWASLYLLTLTCSWATNVSYIISCKNWCFPLLQNNFPQVTRQQPVGKNPFAFKCHFLNLTLLMRHIHLTACWSNVTDDYTTNQFSNKNTLNHWFPTLLLVIDCSQTLKKNRFVIVMKGWNIKPYFEQQILNYNIYLRHILGPHPEAFSLKWKELFLTYSCKNKSLSDSNLFVPVEY